MSSKQSSNRCPHTRMIAEQGKEPVRVHCNRERHEDTDHQAKRGSETFRWNSE